MKGLAPAMAKGGHVPRRNAGRESRSSTPADALLELQRHAGNHAVDRLIAARGSARPVPPQFRREMESRLGTDLQSVRIHDDATANEQAASLGAKAVTVGEDIVFGEGRFAPDTMEGRQLIAHELAHVVQQRLGGASVPRTDGTGPLEAEAGRVAGALAVGSGPVSVSGASAVGPAAAPLPPEQITALTPEQIEALALAQIDEIITLAQARSLTPAQIDAAIIAARNQIDELARTWSDSMEELGTPAKPQPHRPVRARPALQPPNVRVSRNDVEANLQATCEGGGPRAGAAQELLTQIDQQRQNIENLRAARPRNPQRGAITPKTMSSIATWGLEALIQGKLIHDKNWEGLARHNLPPALQGTGEIVNIARTAGNDELWDNADQEVKNKAKWNIGEAAAGFLLGFPGAASVKAAEKISKEPSIYGTFATLSPIGLYNYIFTEGIVDFFRPSAPLGKRLTKLPDKEDAK
jgi:hypothetical protein